MAFQWMRRVLLALAPAALLALAGCGSGTIESQFTPSRMVVFGDALSDMGNNGNRYSVNDNSTQLWAKLIALDYGVALDSRRNGGTDYAVGNARVTAKPDASGNAATPTVKEQIDAFLASGATFGPGDLVVVQGGISDVIVQMQLFRAGTITSDQLIANVRQVGVDLAEQAKRVRAAGATHILVLGTYDLSRTPYGISTGQQTVLSQASTALNDALLVALVNEGQNMLYVDIALLVNLMTGTPSAYNFTNATDVACNTVDPANGIGIGTGQVNSFYCTNATIASGLNYSTTMWADPVYLTPSGHARIADYVFSRLRARW